MSTEAKREADGTVRCANCAEVIASIGSEWYHVLGMVIGCAAEVRVKAMYAPKEPSPAYITGTVRRLTGKFATPRVA